MKKILKTVLTCFVLIALFSIVMCQHSKAEERRHDDEHYFFLIPADWIQIPKDVIIKQDMQRMDEARKREGVFVDFAPREVFQKKAPLMFYKPYFTIYELREGSYFISEGMKISNENIKLGKREEDIYDKSRHIIFHKNKDGEFSVCFLGGERSIEFVFSPSPETFEDDMKTFNDVINSFRLNKGNEFK